MLGASLRMSLHRVVGSAGRHAVSTSLRHQIVRSSVEGATASMTSQQQAVPKAVVARAFSLCATTASNVARYGTGVRARCLGRLTGPSPSPSAAVTVHTSARRRISNCLTAAAPRAPAVQCRRSYTSNHSATSGAATSGSGGFHAPSQGFFARLLNRTETSLRRQVKESQSDIERLQDLNRNNQSEAVLALVRERQLDTKNVDVAVEYLTALTRLGRLDSTTLSGLLRQHQGGAADKLSRLAASDQPILVDVVPRGKGWLEKLPLLLVVAAAIYWVTSSADGGGRSFSFLPGLGDAVGKLSQSTTTFDDVKGAPEAKEELVEIVEFLKNPDRFTSLGGKLPRGVLLVGPPGTGKTLLAKAVAGEAGVPFFFASGSEFEEVFVGLGAKRVRALFQKARQNSPCIVFIDEIDAVGSKRSATPGNSNRQTINQLLSELDGFDGDSGVVVIAATNFSEALDSALIRPGRFDRHVQVSMPDVASRTEILQLYLDKCPVDETVDANVIARGTPGVSGADLANVVNMAAIQASIEGRTMISHSHLEWAKDKMLMGPERKSAVMRPEDLKCTAYHETGHALVALLTPGSMPIHKATIMPRGQALGMVSQLPEHDVVSMSKKQLCAKLDVLMGGRVAEEVFFGEDEVTTGASSDMQQATRLARHMVTQYGFTEAGGLMFTADSSVKDMSPEHRAMVDREVNKILDSAYKRAKKLITSNKGKMHQVAQALLKQETLSGAELKNIINSGHL